MASTESFDPSLYSGLSAVFDPLKLNTFEDSAVFTGNLALEDDSLFPVEWDQEETPPYEGNLYSTPLSWDPPEPKIEPLPTNTPYTAMNTLTLAQQEKLRNIAMPSHLQYRSQHQPKLEREHQEPFGFVARQSREQPTQRTKPQAQVVGRCRRRRRGGR